jgi:hypothetical protein
VRGKRRGDRAVIRNETGDSDRVGADSVGRYQGGKRRERESGGGRHEGERRRGRESDSGGRDFGEKPRTEKPRRERAAGGPPKDGKRVIVRKK